MSRTHCAEIEIRDNDRLERSFIYSVASRLWLCPWFNFCVQMRACENVRGDWCDVRDLIMDPICPFAKREGISHFSPSRRRCQIVQATAAVYTVRRTESIYPGRAKLYRVTAERRAPCGRACRHVAASCKRGCSLLYYLLIARLYTTRAVASTTGITAVYKLTPPRDIGCAPQRSSHDNGS